VTLRLGATSRDKLFTVTIPADTDQAVTASAGAVQAGGVRGRLAELRDGAGAA
jgi:hypothetical protein